MLNDEICKLRDELNKSIEDGGYEILVGHDLIET